MKRQMRVVMMGFVLMCAPFLAHADIIRSFSSDITLSKDSTFTVSEVIQYDFGSAEKHGIFRDIPLTHPEKATSWFLKRSTDVEVTRVTRDGASEPYEISRDPENLHIKIGDAGSTTSGLREYRIDYIVRGGLMYPKQMNPELYWNVTGNGWPAPMLEASSTLHDPDNILGENRSCYRGATGEQASCSIQTRDGGVYFATKNLKAGEGMTFAVDIVSGGVAVVRNEHPIVPVSTIIMAIVGFLWIIWLIRTVYQYRTLHKKNRPVVPQYGPYPDMLPMDTGVLLDSKLDPKDISAGILYLAEQGFLKIKKTERKVLFVFEVDDYEITLLKVPTETDMRFVSAILELLFVDAKSVGATVSLSSIKHDEAKQSKNYNVLRNLDSAVKDDLVSRGYKESMPLEKRIIYGILGSAVFMSVWVGLYFFDRSPIDGVVWLLFGGITFVIVLFALERYTTQGFDALNYLEGFKLYLSVAEKDRIDFHNAPEKSPEHFMSLLPYAMALGVEKEWAKVFEGITIPTPDWYEGGATNTFSAVNLASSLGGFSTSFASSSGSSGGGASGGGGFSGGGGGGGGGGSW